MSPGNRIDAHQHFWDIESGRYAWPTPADGPIYRTYWPDDLEPELRSGGDRRHGPRADGRHARRHRLDAAARSAPRVHRRGRRLGAAGRCARRGGGARCPPRSAAPRDPPPRPPRAGSGLAAPRGRRGGPGRLARRGLRFDVVAVFPDHLRLVPALADRHPDLALVIDHLAKPPFRAAGWATWLAQLRRAAERPNVSAKLSGPRHGGRAEAGRPRRSGRRSTPPSRPSGQTA